MEILEEEYVQSINRFQVVGCLGSGSFGEVKLGIDTFTGGKVALKFIRISSRSGGSGIPKAVFREMEALKQIGENDNILKLIAAFPCETNLVLALEYHPFDLAQLISGADQYIPRNLLKAYLIMLLEAVEFCHARNIIHRDIKPSNILISIYGTLKLADFGLARVFDPSSNASLSHQVSTRWYRAPELLFGSRHYEASIDIWSLAVVTAELILLAPLFPGGWNILAKSPQFPSLESNGRSNDIDQIFKVFQIMGTPNEETWPGVEKLPDFLKVTFPSYEPLELKAIIPQAHIDDITFLETILVLDPKNRLTAIEARNLSYFSKDPFPLNRSSLPLPRGGLKTSSTPIASEISAEAIGKLFDDVFTFC